MAGEKKRLLENFLSLGALQIISYVIPLITLPYLARVLSVGNFGLVFFAFAFMQYFIILTDYGFGLSATREIAVNRHNQNNLSNIFNSVTCIKALLLLVSFLVLIVSICFIPKLRADWLVFVLSFLMVVGNAIYPVWFFQGMERMKYITFLNILSKTIFLVLIFVFVKKDSDYVIVPLLNSLGFLVSGIIGFWFAVKNFNIKLYIPKRTSLVKQFKYSSEFFLSRVSVAAYTNTNTFCLGLIGSNIMVGYYVAAEKIYTAFNSIQLPVSNSLYPYVAKYKDIKLYIKVLSLTLIVNIFVCVVAYFGAKPIIIAFYGQAMLESYKILRIFAFVLLVTCPSIMIGFPLLGALGYTKAVNFSIIIASAFHILGLFLLYVFGVLNVYNIAYLVLTTEIILILIKLFFVLKYKVLKWGGIYAKTY